MLNPYLNLVKKWYLDNISKLFLLAIISAFILALGFTPYINVIFFPTIRFFLILLSAYVIFDLSTNLLVIVSFIAIFFAFAFTAMGLDAVAEPLGIFLYFLLIFILINYLRLILKDKSKF